MKLIEKNVLDYINDVDSILPAPGGGSVAALVGALGVSLGRMAGHFSISKKKFKEASQTEQDEFNKAFNKLIKYKNSLIKGIDEDAISYEKVVASYQTKIEKDIQEALDYSASVALNMQKDCYLAIKEMKKLISLANKYLLSDLLSGSILLNSACEMASLNVKANANSLKDENLKANYLNNSNRYNRLVKAYKNKINKEINN